MKNPAIVLLVGLVMAAAAQGATVYTFSGTWDNPDTGQTVGPFTFSLTTPAPVTAQTTFWPGSDLTCDACGSIFFMPDAFAAGWSGEPSVAVGYTFPSGNGVAFYFAPGAFGTNGTYSSLWSNYVDTLTVTGAADPVGVPEPSTAALLLASAMALKFKPRKR